jgi:hypothetical protein
MNYDQYQRSQAVRSICRVAAPLTVGWNHRQAIRESWRHFLIEKPVPDLVACRCALQRADAEV